MKNIISLKLSCVVLLALAFARSASALNINLNFDPDSTFISAGLTASDIVNMKAATRYAALQFTSRFRDPVDVNIQVNAVPGTSTLGMSNTFLASSSYANLRSAMVADMKTADDAAALAAGGSIPVADPIATSHQYLISRAQAKALALLPNDLATDGTFTFGGGHSYTYDPYNRAVLGKIDFIGVAMHEISEIMGRIGIMGQNLTGQPNYMQMDLFHYIGAGTRGLNDGGGRFFSIDNGSTLLKAFNNRAALSGDLSDWASGTNDTFNAFSSSGVLNDLSPVDIRTMDAIGYNLVQPFCSEVPEEFDGVVAPALPVGWTAVNASGPAPLWITSATTPWTAPNSAFVDDPSVISDKSLITPGIFISIGAVKISFLHSFNFEASSGLFFDGGVLEVSSPNINNGAWTDITNAAVGGSFTSGGYTGTLSTVHGNPLGGRMAWSGNSGGYVNVVANVGPNLAGQTVQFRFRMGSDNSASGLGWRVDNFAVYDDTCTLTAAVSRKAHGSAGSFNVILPYDAVSLNTSLGIEPRSGGPTKAYQIMFLFPLNVTFVGASIDAGTGVISSSSGSGTSTLTLNLTGVANAQKLVVHLNGVSSSDRTGDFELPIGFLIGDANFDGSVNAGDTTLTRSRSGVALDFVTFRSDYNVDGLINAGDATIARSNSGNFIP